MTGTHLVDFEWHSPGDEDKQWIADQFGTRDQLRARAVDRENFIRTIDALTRHPTLIPSGRPDRVGDSLRYAREAVNALGPNAEVWSTVTLTRPGLSDPQVMMQMNQLHKNVAGVYLVIYDNAGFPAAWSDEELREYLKVAGTQALAGRATAMAHADVRGLLAVALGATQLGTGVFKSMKQYGIPPSTGGAQPGQAPPPTASYLSLPLLATMHGDNAQAILGANVNEIESHDASLPNCILQGLPPAGSAWAAWLNPAGNANVDRGLLGVRALAAAESQLRASPSPGDLMESWLDNAARIAQATPAEAFQTNGLRAEVLARPRVFREARGFLGV